MTEPITPQPSPSPSPARPVLPLPRQLKASDWIIRAILWIAVIAGFLLMLRFDVPLMQWRYRHIPQEVEGWNKQIVLGLRDFGQVLPITVGVIIIFRVDRRRWVIIAAVLLAQLLASAGYNTGKYAIARYRPNAALEQQAGGSYAELKPGQSWVGIKPGFRQEETRSFPSGHSAASFAFAGVLAWFYPQLRRLWWILAIGCACSRFIDAVHWPTDCWVGATIGYLAAWIALRPYVWVLPVIYTRRIIKRRQAAERRK